MSIFKKRKSKDKETAKSFFGKLGKHAVKTGKEFHDFINRGNVIDLAVGMMMGTTFTAVVSAIVNNIFGPFVKWTQSSGSQKPLQTALPVYDSAGNVVPESAIIIDWSAVLSAVLTFFLTALVAFALVKMFAYFRRAGEKIKATSAEHIERIAEDIKQKLKENDTDEENSEEASAVSTEADITAGEETVKTPAEPTPVEAPDSKVKNAENIEILLKQIITLLEQQKS